jgi:uncharacterized protein
MTDAQPVEIREDGFLDESRGFTTGLGGSYTREKASLQALTDLYDSNWLARTIIDTLPSAVFKGGVTFDDPSMLTAFTTANSHPMNPEGHLHNAMCQGRIHGGYVLAVLPLRGAPENPWKPSDLYAHVIGAPWAKTVPTIDRDPASPLLGQPKSYKFTSDPTFSKLDIHASRCLVFEGAPKATQTLETPWVSVLELVFNEIVDFGLSWTAVSQLIREASLLWLRMQGLTRGLATGRADDAVKGKIKFNAKTKSIMNMLFLDDGEDAGRIAVSFADLPSLMQELSIRTAAAARLPVTKLFGRSPAGMNATGESDLRQFYDDVLEYRGKNATQKVSRFCELTTGKIPSVVRFQPLWQPSAKEAEDLRKSRFEADKLVWELGSLDARAVLLARAKDGTLGFTLSDPQIKALEIALATPKKETTADMSVTDTAFYITVNEARAQAGYPADPIDGTKKLAQVKAEMAAIESGANRTTTPPDPATLP